MFLYSKIFCPCQTRFRIQSCTYSIFILWERLHAMQGGRASLWPQQGHYEENRGWMTLLQFIHPQIQKIISLISCLCHEVLYSLFFQKIVWDAFEATGTFLVDYHTLCFVQPLPEALSPRAPASLLQLTFLLFLAIPPGSRPLPCPCSAASSLQMLLNYPTVSWPWLESHSSFYISAYLPFLNPACQHYG